MAQINKPSDYFNTKLYTGTGSSLGVTGVGFQPDLVWLKSRNTTYNHALFDNVRGTGAYINSNTTSAEGSTATSLSAFDSDGFTVVSDGFVNNSGTTFASWNWLASNTTASNTDGSITSTVSANTTSGFSIVSYTGNGTAGATIGHSLGTAPSMIITKNRDSGGSGYWGVYHQSLGNTQALFLNLTNASGTNVAYWNNTSPTSSVFTLGDGSTSNVSGENFIAYCFAEKKGFSKFGSYTGNGSTDGTFVYTGFKPAFVMCKSSSNSLTYWYMYDNKRNGYNVDNDALYANDSGTGQTGDTMDILSNGFKFRANDSNVNASGYTMIYMAFAESPLVGTNNIPAVAR